MVPQVLGQVRGGSDTVVGNQKWTGGGDFPGGPVAKTPCSQCKGPGFDP